VIDVFGLLDYGRGHWTHHCLVVMVQSSYRYTTLACKLTNFPRCFLHFLPLVSCELFVDMFNLEAKFGISISGFEEIQEVQYVVPI